MPPNKILCFWFSEDNKLKWFKKDAVFDKQVKDAFLDTYKAVKDGLVNSWEETPKNLLVLVLLFDQFPRNMFRNNKGSFETDILALKIARTAIGLGWDKELTNTQRMFLYMPFMHSELLENQEDGLKLFKDLEEKMTVG